MQKADAVATPHPDIGWRFNLAGDHWAGRHQQQLGHIVAAGQHMLLLMYHSLSGENCQENSCFHHSLESLLDKLQVAGR